MFFQFVRDFHQCREQFKKQSAYDRNLFSPWGEAFRDACQAGGAAARSACGVVFTSISGEREVDERMYWQTIMIESMIKWYKERIEDIDDLEVAVDFTDSVGLSSELLREIATSEANRLRYLLEVVLPPYLDHSNRYRTRTSLGSSASKENRRHENNVEGVRMEIWEELRGTDRDIRMFLSFFSQIDEILWNFCNETDDSSTLSAFYADYTELNCFADVFEALTGVLRAVESTVHDPQTASNEQTLADASSRFRHAAWLFTERLLREFETPEFSAAPPEAAEYLLFIRREIDEYRQYSGVNKAKHPPQFRSPID